MRARRKALDKVGVEVLRARLRRALRMTIFPFGRPIEGLAT
jgi:hypothetical protein